MSLNLAVCAEMVFLDLPFLQRVERIHELGFAVEMWDSRTKDIAGLAATGANFSSMTGYSSGSLIDPDSCEQVLRSAAELIPSALELGIERMVVHPAELIDGQAASPIFRATGQMWLTAARTLEKLGDLGAEHGIVFTVENLNTIVDHPGIPLGRAKDTLALVEGVGHPNVKMMLDLYHAQIGEGNLIALLRDSIEHLGEVQVADVPGRCEPGTGEINYPAIAAELRALGYTGTVGLEGWASGDPEAALAGFRNAFT